MISLPDTEWIFIEIIRVYDENHTERRQRCLEQKSMISSPPERRLDCWTGSNAKIWDHQSTDLPQVRKPNFCTEKRNGKRRLLDDLRKINSLIADDYTRSILYLYFTVCITVSVHRLRSPSAFTVCIHRLHTKPCSEVVFLQAWLLPSLSLLAFGGLTDYLSVLPAELLLTRHLRKVSEELCLHF